MGNPAILNRMEEPRPRRWKVYRLRDRGKKLSTDQVRATESQGRLTITRGTAVLQDSVYGHDLGRLEHIRLWKMSNAGGLLLHGTELFQTRSMIRDDPQGWWCVPLE